MAGTGHKIGTGTFEEHNKLFLTSTCWLTISVTYVYLLQRKVTREHNLRTKYASRICYFIISALTYINPISNFLTSILITTLLIIMKNLLHILSSTQQQIKLIITWMNVNKISPSYNCWYLFTVNIRVIYRQWPNLMITIYREEKKNYYLLYFKLMYVINKYSYFDS